MVRKPFRLRGLLLLCLFLLPCLGTLIYQEKSGTMLHPADNYSPVTIHIQNGRRDEILTLDEYLKGVVAAQLSPESETEAVKAQTVVNQTYVFYVAGDRTALEGSWLNQTWLSAEERLNKGWIEDKLIQAVSDTKDCKIYSNGTLILPLFFRLSNGKTRSFAQVWDKEVNYLIPVESLWDKSSPEYMQTIQIPLKRLIEYLKEEDSSAEGWKELTPSMVQVVEKDESGYIRQIQIGNVIYDGEALRYMLSLPSACFDVSVSGKNMVFTCYGEGHGVGLSLYGANEMAKEGKSYTEILSYYYSGVEIH